MEAIVQSIVTKYLKEFVNNFRKEQISVNFLRGQGVIHDLDINVDAINDAVFSQGSPGLQFTRIIINTLSIEAPLMSLKSKPIVVHIDEIFIEICEIEEIIKKPRTVPPKRTFAKYGFLDRVVDSLSFQVNRVLVGFRTLGRLKSPVIGPHTPPVLLVELCGNKFHCVDHNGAEVSLDECLRVRATKRPMLFLYKSLTIDKVGACLINPMMWFRVADELIGGASVATVLRMRLGKSPDKNRGRGKNRAFSTTNNVNDNRSSSSSGSNSNSSNSHSHADTPSTDASGSSPSGDSSSGYSTIQQLAGVRLVEDASLAVSMCMRKRLENNVLLGLELAVDVKGVHVTLAPHKLRELIHFIVGVLYCSFRSDVIEEVYGPDPHDELGDLASAASAAAGATASLNSGVAPPRRAKLSRTDVAKDALPSLDALDAEIGAGAKVVVTDGSDNNSFNGVVREAWQRCSLDEETDAPHVRLVIVVECSEGKVSFPLGPELDGDKGKGSSSVPTGLTVTLHGLVHTTLWPEWASATQSVLQTTLKHLSVHHYHGITRTLVLSTKAIGDSLPASLLHLSPAHAGRGEREKGERGRNEGVLAPISLLPRGVKEHAYHDRELLPSQAVILKKECNWPALPIHKGLGVELEMVMAPLEVVLTAQGLECVRRVGKLVGLVWDSRWWSGCWEGEGSGPGGAQSSAAVSNSEMAANKPSLTSSGATVKAIEDAATSFVQSGPPGRLESMHPTGSSSNTLVLQGLQIILNPPTSSSSPLSSSASASARLPLPAVPLPQVCVGVGMATLAWRHSLDFSFADAMLLPGQAVDDSVVAFPNAPTDITSLMRLTSISMPRNKSASMSRGSLGSVSGAGLDALAQSEGGVKGNIGGSTGTSASLSCQDQGLLTPRFEAAMSGVSISLGFASLSAHRAGLVHTEIVSPFNIRFVKSLDPFAREQPAEDAVDANVSKSVYYRDVYHTFFDPDAKAGSSGATKGTTLLQLLSIDGLGLRVSPKQVLAVAAMLQALEIVPLHKSMQVLKTTGPLQLQVQTQVEPQVPPPPPGGWVQVLMMRAAGLELTGQPTSSPAGGRAGGGLNLSLESFYLVRECPYRYLHQLQDGGITKGSFLGAALALGDIPIASLKPIPATNTTKGWPGALFRYAASDSPFGSAARGGDRAASGSNLLSLRLAPSTLLLSPRCLPRTAEWLAKEMLMVVPVGPADDPLITQDPAVAPTYTWFSYLQGLCSSGPSNSTAHRTDVNDESSQPTARGFFSSVDADLSGLALVLIDRNDEASEGSVRGSGVQVACSGLRMKVYPNTISAGRSILYSVDANASLGMRSSDADTWVEVLSPVAVNFDNASGVNADSVLASVSPFILQMPRDRIEVLHGVINATISSISSFVSALIKAAAASTSMAGEGECRAGAASGTDKADVLRGRVLAALRIVAVKSKPDVDNNSPSVTSASDLAASSPSQAPSSHTQLEALLQLLLRLKTSTAQLADIASASPPGNELKSDAAAGAAEAAKGAGQKNGRGISRVDSMGSLIDSAGVSTAADLNTGPVSFTPSRPLPASLAELEGGSADVDAGAGSNAGGDQAGGTKKGALRGGWKGFVCGKAAASEAVDPKSTSLAQAPIASVATKPATAAAAAAAAVPAAGSNANTRPSSAPSDACEGAPSPSTWSSSRQSSQVAALAGPLLHEVRDAITMLSSLVDSGSSGGSVSDSAALSTQTVAADAGSEGVGEGDGGQGEALRALLVQIYVDLCSAERFLGAGVGAGAGVLVGAMFAPPAPRSDEIARDEAAPVWTAGGSSESASKTSALASEPDTQDASSYPLALQRALVQLDTSQRTCLDLQASLHGVTATHIDSVQRLSTQLRDLTHQLNAEREVNSAYNSGSLYTGYSYTAPIAATSQAPLVTLIETSALPSADGGSAAGEAMDINELVRHLSHAAETAERGLLAAEERAVMLQEEMDSLVVETDYTRRRNLRLTDERAALEEAHALALSEARRELEALHSERQSWEGRMLRREAEVRRMAEWLRQAGVDVNVSVSVDIEAGEGGVGVGVGVDEGD